MVYVETTAQNLEHFVCKRSSPTLNSRYTVAVSWKTGRPTCHPQTASCATSPRQWALVLGPDWFGRTSCLFEAHRRPIARYFRAFHTAARNPSQEVVFARLSCDQAVPYCGDVRLRLWTDAVGFLNMILAFLSTECERLPKHILERFVYTTSTHPLVD